MGRMEVPRHWREMPVNTSFRGREIKTTTGEPFSYKYPGGEINLGGPYEEIYDRFEAKGFKKEVIEKILPSLGTITAEAAIPMEEVVDRQLKLVGGEIRKQGRSEVKLGVDSLPRKVTRKTLFAASANDKVRIGEASGI